MKKISTVATNRNKIFKKPELTIGLDLGDRISHYCILNKAGEVILEHSLPTTPKGIHQDQQDLAQSHRAGNRDAFTVGKPAVDPVGPRSDRGARKECALDRGEPPKR